MADIGYRVKQVLNGSKEVGKAILKHPGKALMALFLIYSSSNGVKNLTAAEKFNLFLHGDFAYRNFSSLNSELAKVSDAEGLSGLGFGGGITGLYNLGKGLWLGIGTRFKDYGKTDTSLTGMDGSQVPTGSVSLNSIEGFITGELELAGNDDSNLSLYSDIGAKIDNRTQTANNETYKVNTTKLKAALGFSGKIMKYIKAKLGYDIANREAETSIGLNIPFGKKRWKDEYEFL